MPTLCATNGVHADAKVFASFADSAPKCSVNDDRTALRERIREANDIVDVVGSYITLRQAGPIYKGLCPFHDDKHPSLTVDPIQARDCNEETNLSLLANHTAVRLGQSAWVPLAEPLSPLSSGD